MAEQERVAVGHGDGVRPSSLERMYHRGGKSLAAVAMLATGMFGMFTPGARSKEEQAIAGSGREIERVVSAGEGAKEQRGEVSALELLKSEASGVESNRPVSAGLDLARIFSRRVGLTRNTEAVSAVVNLQEQLAAGRHLSDLKLRVTGREVRPVRTVESVKQSRAEAKPKVVDGITKNMVAKAASSRPSASKSSTSRAVVKDWDVAELSAASVPEAPLGVAGINIAERLTLKWKASLSSSEWTLIDGNDLIVKEMTDGRYEILYLHDGALPAGFFQVGLNLSEGEPECELLKVNAMSLAGSAGVAQLLGARSLTELPAGALPLSFVAMVVLKPQVEYPHDMVLVPGRRVTVGTDNYYRSEGPAVELDVPSVLVSRFEISIGFAAEQLDYLFQEGVLEYLDYWNGLDVNYDSPHPLYTGDYIAKYGLDMFLWEYNPADYPGLTKEEAAVVAASNASTHVLYITDGHIRPLPGIENYPYRSPVVEMFTIMN